MSEQNLINEFLKYISQKSLHLNTQGVVLKRNVNVIVIMCVTRKNLAGKNLRIVKI